MNTSSDSLISHNGLESTLRSAEDVDAYVSDGKDEGSARINDYHRFATHFYEGVDAPLRQTRFESVFRIGLGSLDVGIAAFNSSWRCYNSEQDKGKLLIGQRQVLRALGDLEGCDVRVAVVHHPLSYLSPFDRETVEPLIMKEFDLMLCGHEHEAGTQTTWVMGNALCVLSAPGVLHQNTNSDSRTYANGYRIITFDPRSREVASYSRRYAPKKTAFDPNTDDGDSEGKAVYQLPSEAEWSRYDEQRRIAGAVSDRYRSDLNRHLLSYGTDTAAPQDIDDIFVMPEVVQRKRAGDEERVRERTFTLGELADGNSNFLLLGKRESGKTTLLNRLILKLTEDVDEHHMLPVFIDFQSLGNRKIESEVKKYLSVSSADVGRLASQQSLVLMVDDITFEEIDRRRIMRLSNFVSEYPNTRIIATHRQHHSGELPTGPHESLRFEPLEIKSFRVRQIRQLVQRWFAESNAVDTPAQLKNIVSLFEVLDIPRTPLSVSILLWIVEKQEGYRPKNKATMVENFVERLLMKHGLQEVYSDRFDFKNKQHLLADLSHRMYEAGAADYRIRYSEALSFCEKHLEGREFEFEAQPILDSFVEAGIFAKSNGSLQFRFECFFEYFLAKKMEFDKAFYEEVLHEENYLKFADQIEYYTGIKRDQADILEILSERLALAYEPITEDLLEVEGSHDDFFAPSFSLVRSLDESSALQRVEESRPTEKDIEAMQDQRLELTAPRKGIRRKEEPENPFERLRKMLFLTARVLRHTEETTRSKLKTDSYRKVVSSALTYTVLYKYILLHYLEHSNELQGEFEEAVSLVVDYTPFVMQIMLHEEVGTQKLNKVIRDEIKRVLARGEISDLEKFFSVFLYAENRGVDYLKYVKRFVGEFNNRYMEDVVYLKLVTYYHVRSGNKDLDNKLLNLIADVMVKAKGLHPSQKGSIIEEHKKRKFRQEASSAGETQAALDL